MMKEWNKAKEIATLALRRLPEHEPSLVMVIMADVALGNMEELVELGGASDTKSRFQLSDLAIW